MARGDQSKASVAREKEYEELDLKQLVIAAIGAISVGVLYMLVRDILRLGPPWLVLGLEVVLLAPSLISTLILRRPMPFVLARGLTLALLVVVSVSLIASIILLVQRLLVFTSTLVLLEQAGLLWVINVLVFASWYWEIDGGGPLKRMRMGHKAADFQFPQQVDGNPTRWAPGFVDYLFLAFCFATALSPADTPPLSRGGKGLMMIQAIISLAIVVVLVGRSINIGK